MMNLYKLETKKEENEEIGEVSVRNQNITYYNEDIEHFLNTGRTLEKHQNIEGNTTLSQNKIEILS